MIAFKLRQPFALNEGMRSINWKPGPGRQVCHVCKVLCMVDKMVVGINNTNDMYSTMNVPPNLADGQYDASSVRFLTSGPASAPSIT